MGMFASTQPLASERGNDRFGIRFCADLKCHEACDVEAPADKKVPSRRRRLPQIIVLCVTDYSDN